MSKILELLCTEYEKVYVLKMKKNYSIPKIYHGGDDYDLTKRWYVYYSNRHPETGKSVWASSFFKAFIKLEAWRSPDASPEIIQYFKVKCVYRYTKVLFYKNLLTRIKKAMTKQASKTPLALSSCFFFKKIKNTNKLGMAARPKTFP